MRESRHRDTFQAQGLPNGETTGFSDEEGSALQPFSSAIRHAGRVSTAGVVA